MPNDEGPGESWSDAVLGAVLRRRARDGDPSTADPGGAERFVVVTYDPQTGETDSYGPYGAASAVTECRRRRAAFDEGDLDDVIVAVVPLWRP
ncbi:hypothetical protein [Actinomycetospora chiangmaiensis]|uniref:hypothetical protein n=1 Tax=Actinomycetospora chiangmaiensis TaxID=402650 RepID=UPI00037A1082|nr:hypothetical protein [Actinomycetospora chiangmaiensis]